MVVFTCQHCGDSLQKPKVEKHYNTKCRFNNPYLTCVDCLKDFTGDAYDAHTQCVSEAERYSAKGTVIKEYAGRNKQAKYVEMIKRLLNSTNLTNTQRNLLEVCSKFDNVPRKENKFFNFLRNAVGKCSSDDSHSVFKLLEEAWAKEMAASKAETPEKTSTSPSKEESNVNCENNDSKVSIDQDSEPEKSKKKKRDKSLNSFAEEQRTIENDNSVDDAKENMDVVSRKKLKKQKKYEKYLRELENESKAVEKFDSGEDESKINDKKSKKKSKTREVNHILPECNGGTENNEQVSSEEHIHKKNKKRKLNKSECEVAEKKQKEDSTAGEEPSESQATFDWADVIVRVLQSRSDSELSLKRLAKKVVGEYQIVKQDHRTHEELMAKFNKKVKKVPGVRVLKDKAKLIE